MHMARVSVYLSDELAQQARDANINVSALTQRAITNSLEAAAIGGWLDRLADLPATGVGHADALAALDAARNADFGIDNDYP